MRTGRAAAALVVMLAVTAAPAQSQGALRAAVSPALTPEAAQEVFADAFLDGCIAAVASGRRLADVMGGALSEDADAETRKQAGAAAEDTVYDVTAARGVVTAHDRPGRCVVSVYGPPAAMSVVKLTGRLTGQGEGFERLAATQNPTGLGASLFKVVGDKRLQVTLSGSEPGMPGHQSRFSVISATVFATPAR